MGHAGRSAGAVSTGRRADRAEPLGRFRHGAAGGHGHGFAGDRQQLHVIAELVTHEVSGYVFPTGDHQALADVLARIQKPRLLDLGSEGRNIVRERFSAALMIRQTYDVYCAPTY